MFDKRFLFGPLLDAASDGSGEGTGGGTGNPALDEKKVLDIVNNAINGFAKRQDKEITKQFGTFGSRLDEVMKRLEGSGASNNEGNNGTDGDGSGDGNGAGTEGKGEKLDPRTRARMDKYERDHKKLQERLDAEQKAREEASNRAAETERLSTLRGELSKYPILPDNVDDMFDLFKSKVKRDEDGQYVVGDTTMEAYIRQTMDRMPGMLRPVDKSGAGSSAGHGGKGSRLDLNDIRPGASKETLDAARAEILKLIPRQGY